MIGNWDKSKRELHEKDNSVQMADEVLVGTVDGGTFEYKTYLLICCSEKGGYHAKHNSSWSKELVLENYLKVMVKYPPCVGDLKVVVKYPPRAGDSKVVVKYPPCVGVELCRRIEGVGEPVQI